MGKSFKSRIAKKVGSLRSLLCCCCIKNNKVAPLDIGVWTIPSALRNVDDLATCDSEINIVEALADSGILYHQRLQSPEIHVCHSALYRDVDIAEINIVSSLSCIIKSKTRIINENSDLLEDTPLPFYIRSAETDAIQGIIIRGSFAQDSIGPMFTNAQCTSMAYQALAYKMVCGQPFTWDYRDIDAILQQGHILHSHFRNVLKLSTNVDNRIAIDELPRSYEVRVFPASCIAGPESSTVVQNVQMTVSYDAYGIYKYDNEEIAASFNDVATEFPVFISKTFSTDNVEDVNMILTIADFSMAIWRQSTENVIWLFDSHRRDPTGLIHAVSIWETDTFDNGAALARSFDSVDALLTHLTEIYGKSFYYNARFFNLDMGNSDSVSAAENKSDGVQDKENSQDDMGNSGSVPAAENKSDGAQDKENSQDDMGNSDSVSVAENKSDGAQNKENSHDDTGNSGSVSAAENKSDGAQDKENSHDDMGNSGSVSAAENKSDGAQDKENSHDDMGNSGSVSAAENKSDGAQDKENSHDDMGNSDSVPAAEKKSDGAQDKENPQEGMSADASLDEEKQPP